MRQHRIYKMPVAKVYPHYVTKAEKKGRTKDEVNEIIRWLTGCSQEELEKHLEEETLNRSSRKLPSSIPLGARPRASSAARGWKKSKSH